MEHRGLVPVQNNMKTILSSCVAVLLLAATAISSRAEIIAGPITNPGNGHDYYLLKPDSWTACEAEAESLGGTLAVINDVGEQEWVYATFGSYGGTNRNLWLGLRRQWAGGPFVWITGEKSEYRHWHAGQPDNAGNNENCAHVWGRNSDNPDAWNDLNENYSADDQTPHGLVEVPGKSNPKALGETEKSLVGVWYESGKANRPCWITATEHILFAIDPNLNTSRLVVTTEGNIFSAHWKQYAEIVKDRLLWSRGGWWSRQPADYGTVQKPSNK